MGQSHSTLLHFPKTIEDLPQPKLLRMMAKLCIVGSLAWDYAETVRTLAAQMQLSATKSLSRAVRELHADFDRFRQSSLSAADVKKESDLGLLFEQICEEHLSKFSYGFNSEKEIALLSDDFRMLVKAVQMAMTVIDAMKLYAGECDKWIAENGVCAHSMLPDHFRRLAILLPEFAGDHYNKDSEVRRLTAHILFKEIKNIDIYDENGKV